MAPRIGALAWPAGAGCRRRPRETARSTTAARVVEQDCCCGTGDAERRQRTKAEDKHGRKRQKDQHPAANISDRQQKIAGTVYGREQQIEGPDQDRTTKDNAGISGGDDKGFAFGSHRPVEQWPSTQDDCAGQQPEDGGDGDGITRPIDSPGRDALDRARAIAVTTPPPATDFRGCAFLNALAELGNEDSEARKLAVASRKVAGCGIVTCCPSLTSMTPIRWQRSCRGSSMGPMRRS